MKIVCIMTELFRIGIEFSGIIEMNNKIVIKPRGAINNNDLTESLNTLSNVNLIIIITATMDNDHGSPSGFNNSEVLIRNPNNKKKEDLIRKVASEVISLNF